jgi:hypothetical protein
MSSIMALALWGALSVAGARTFVVQTLWAEKIQSTTDAGSLNTFGRNEVEVAPISSALLRIACE